MLCQETGRDFAHLTDATDAVKHELSPAQRQTLAEINARANKAKHSGFLDMDPADKVDYQKLDELLGVDQSYEDEEDPAPQDADIVNWCSDCAWFESPDAEPINADKIKYLEPRLWVCARHYLCESFHVSGLG